MIVLLGQGELQTKFGAFSEYLFYDGRHESIALVKGDVCGKTDVLCRVHSHCVPAHLFNSIECDCREQMAMAQQKMDQEGRGVIVWLDQEGKGNGHLAALLSSKLKAQGVAQTEAFRQLGYDGDARSFIRAAEILKYLAVESVRLLSNNPDKSNMLAQAGVNVSAIDSLIVPPDNPFAEKAYRDKVEHQGHSIPL